MRNTTLSLNLLFSALCFLGVTLLSVGCDDSGERACNSDSDCPSSQVCTSDNVCAIPVALGIPSQDVPGDSQPDSTPDTVPDAPNPDVPDPDVMPDFPDPDFTDPDVNDGLDYRFVRIDDISMGDDRPNSGANIDALVLNKPDGRQFYAATVQSYVHGQGLGDKLDPGEALGAPDAFYDYPNVSFCDVRNGYVSLGGIGGQLIVEMDDAVEQGDILRVLEVGNCITEEGLGADPNAIEVFVSVADDDSRDWVVLGGGGISPALTFEVPRLPFEPAP